MSTQKIWLIKEGALYKSILSSHQFYMLWFAFVFLIVSLILKEYYQAIMIIIYFTIPLCMFIPNIVRFGLWGQPLVLFSDEKIIVHKDFSFGLDKPVEILIYPDDDVHIVGAKNQRFIRLVNRKYPSRELKLYRSYSQRLIKFITNRLRRKHNIILEDYPSFLSQCRGDY